MSPYLYPGIPRHLMYLERNSGASRESNISLHVEMKCNVIIETVAKYYGISVQLLKSKSRKQELVLCRNMCILFLCKKTPAPYKMIGRLLSNRDHSTVLHSKDMIEGKINTDNKLRKDFNTISELLKF